MKYEGLRGHTFSIKIKEVPLRIACSAQKPHSEHHSERVRLQCISHSRALQENKNGNSNYQHKKIETTQKANTFSNHSRNVKVCSQGVEDLLAVTKDTTHINRLGSLEP